MVTLSLDSPLRCLGICVGQVAYLLHMLKELMRLHIGAHHLAIETGRWQRPIVPRDECLCSRCTRRAIEDEFHVLFKCPAYQQIRLKYGSTLFSRFGDSLQSAIRVLTREPRKVPEFMNQEPVFISKVWLALWLSACINIGRVWMIQFPMGMCTIPFLQVKLLLLWR
jgi:hypothetical protein